MKVLISTETHYILGQVLQITIGRTKSLFKGCPEALKFNKENTLFSTMFHTLLESIIKYSNNYEKTAFCCV